MADDGEDIAAGKTTGASVAESMALAGAGRAKADAYLDEQIEVAKLQKKSLIDQNEFELSHLRWRRFNDQMKGALQIMLVAIGAVVVVAIAAAMWRASHADGLVVESFSVPPQYAQTGIGGDVIADDLTNKLGIVGDIANSGSLDNSKDVRNDREDVKVEIPDTGISLAQIWRALRLWFGHERRLSGSLRNVGDGKIALTVALQGEEAFTLTGAPGDLDKLEQQAAERVFAAGDPTNYPIYLDLVGRPAETIPALQRAARLLTDPTELADTYSLWSYETRLISGDMARADALSRLAISIDPKIAAPHVELIRDSEVLGHDEVGLQEALKFPAFRREDQPPSQQGAGFTAIVHEAELERSTDLGDFQQAESVPCTYHCGLAREAVTRAEYAARLHDVAQSQALLSRALAAGSARPDGVARSRYFSDAARADWRAAAADARTYGAALLLRFGKVGPLTVRTNAQPLLGIVLAHMGDFAAAHVAVDSTPLGCYLCLRVRGQIEALQGNRAGAQAWFARAVAAGPSLPFAYAEWGAMLLAKGDYDGAIAKFRIANQKGPHFADPIEMWGEALIAKNRSDLAIAKFAEAEKYAPNWGGLHLKWGEALLWSGDKVGAQKQFAAAAALDLTPSEKSELSRMTHG